MAYLISPWDGIFGCGFKAISVDSVTPFFQMLYDEKVIENPVFSFYLSSDSSQKGEVIFGDIGHHTGEINWVNLSQETYWIFDLKNSNYGSSTLTSIGQAVADTGTSLMVIPTADMKNLASKIGAKSSFLNPNAYTIDCSKIHSLENIVFTIGVNNYSLTPNQYIIQESNMCLLGLSGMDINFVIIGDIFLRHYLSVFDQGNNRFGLAELPNQYVYYN